MSPRVLAAFGVVLPVLLKMHLSVTTAGTTVSLSVPVILAVALVLAAAVLLWVAWKVLRGFRSSPYPRQVSNWST